MNTNTNLKQSPAARGAIAHCRTTEITAAVCGAARGGNDGLMAHLADWIAGTLDVDGVRGEITRYRSIEHAVAAANRANPAIGLDKVEALFSEGLTAGEAKARLVGIDRAASTANWPASASQDHAAADLAAGSQHEPPDTAAGHGDAPGTRLSPGWAKAVAAANASLPPNAVLPGDTRAAAPAAAGGGGSGPASS